MTVPDVQTLCDDLTAVLAAVRDRYAAQAEMAADWVELGQFDIARAVAAEIDVIADAVEALVGDDIGLQLVGRLTNLDRLAVALDVHDPQR